MLGVVVALIYLTLHKGVGKLVQKSQQGKRVRVVERVSLDQKRAIYLVEVDGREVVLGGGDGGVVHLFDTAPKAAAVAASTTTTKSSLPAPAPVPLTERFTNALSLHKPVTPPITRGMRDDDVATLPGTPRGEV
jgi:flagellar biogenesis protein FliO